MERQLIVVTGPTASGKTEFSILLAALMHTEIISADSRQFYKYMDIGTAKPSVEQLSGIKHHLISFLSPDESYNVSKYTKDALQICEKLWNEKKIPIVAGGSGLYIKALIDGIAETPDPDPELRKRLMEERSLFGNEYIYKKLSEADPQSAAELLPQNWKRVIRALEVFHLTGKSVRHFHEEQRRKNYFTPHFIGLTYERPVLYQRINSRVDAMIAAGLINETADILKMGYRSDLNALNTVGYKECISFLNGEISEEECISLIKRNTRRYAKRQLTWFRKDERIKWETLAGNEDLIIFAQKTAELFRNINT